MRKIATALLILAASPAVAADLAALRQRVERLKDHDAIENLQAQFGYYFDRLEWNKVSGLFAGNGTFEYGQSGVYVGKGRIRRALDLIGPAGPTDGSLNIAMQLQPIITVAADGRTAQARYQGIGQWARPGANGRWQLGIYENAYVKEDGRWKIAALRYYVTAVADYDLGWAKGPIPMDGPSAALPPDRPPTEVYRSLPGVHLPAFHFRHPVTGRVISTLPPAPNSVRNPDRKML